MKDEHAGKKREPGVYLGSRKRLCSYAELRELASCVTEPESVFCGATLGPPSYLGVDIEDLQDSAIEVLTADTKNKGEMTRSAQNFVVSLMVVVYKVPRRSPPEEDDEQEEVFIPISM